ncbi:MULTISPECIES: ABC transporter permease [Paenibacillus]|uniref:Transport permease protein n=1 Tax=Paenibacillus borealis TaxID=160799 RepID=A0ABX3HIH8_PAEBO|nr:ABC transporter permease [Paenibacillus borealis]OMD49559.1 ABC transporter permease [Paenibacillus borealis]
MKKDIWFLVWRTLKATFRKRSALILYFGLPVAGILLCTLLYGSQGPTVLKVGIVNKDTGGRIAADTLGFMRGLDNIQLAEVTENELTTRLASGKLDSGLIMESGYSESVLQGEPGHIEIESLKGAEATLYLKSMLYGYIDHVAAIGRAAGGEETAFNELYEEYRSAEFQLQSEWVEDTSAAQEMSFQSIGFLIMFMMTSAVNLSELILKNRENRTYFRILSSPVHARTYVLSNIIVNLLIMIAQIAVTLFVMREVFRLDPGVAMWEMFGLLILFALVSVSISLVIVSVAKSTAAAGALQNLIIVPTCFISGCFFPVSVMPEAVQRIASFLPQTWVLESFESLQSGENFGGIGFNLLILFAFSVVFFLLATYNFGRNNDTRHFV